MPMIITFALTLLTGILSVPLQAQDETYELPSYTDAQRWNRSATLLIAVLVGDIAGDKEAGMSAEEAGRAAAAIFGPPNGWNSSNTPMRLFRGINRNWMSHPEQTCDLLEAAPTVVRARCNRPYLTYFGDDGESYGVTVQDYEDSSRGFAAAIADHHGMDWRQEIVDGDLMITIRTR